MRDSVELGGLSHQRFLVMYHSTQSYRLCITPDQAPCLACSNYHCLCAGTWQPLQFISSHDVQHFFNNPQPSRSHRNFLHCLTSVHCFHSCVSPQGMYSIDLPFFASHVRPSFALAGCFAWVVLPPPAVGLRQVCPFAPPLATPVFPNYRFIIEYHALPPFRKF